MITIATIFPKSEKDLTFRSYSDALRWMADHCHGSGYKRTVSDLHFGKDANNWFTRAQFRDYFRSGRWRVTEEQATRIIALHQRYMSFCHYVQEVEPNWQEVERVYYADNSVEAIEQDKYGNKRRVYVTMPHGDACF